MLTLPPSGQGERGLGRRLMPDIIYLQDSWMSDMFIQGMSWI
jgi:hypothetical protein